MRQRIALALAVIPLVIALAACGAERTTTAPERPRLNAASTGDAADAAPTVTLVRTETGVSGVRTDTSDVVWSAEGAVAAIDGSAVYSPAGDGQLERLDRDTGGPTTTWPMEPGFAPVLVEPGGERVVLSDRPIDTDSWTTSRASTQLRVLDTKSGAVGSLTVAGDFEPEAFGSYPSALFGLAHVGDHYRVVVLDLVTGAVTEVSDSNKNPAESMRGRPIHGVLDRARTRLSTLYVNADDPDDPAFVHVLSLEGWSYCVDLPAEFASGPARSQSIEITEDVLVVRAPAADQRATFNLHWLDQDSGPRPAVIETGAGSPADATYRFIPGFVAALG